MELFEWNRKTDRLVDQCVKFHRANPEIWKMFCHYTFQVLRAGRSHYSANAIFERIRWHTTIDTVGSDFKISNNHRAYYSRFFHNKYPEHNGFFRTNEVGQDIAHEIQEYQHYFKRYENL